MNTRIASVGTLGATLILAAAPVLARDATTTTEALDLQLRTQLQTQQRQEWRPDHVQTGDAAQSQLQTRTRLQTQTRSQTHVMLQDGRQGGTMGSSAARSGKGAR